MCRFPGDGMEQRMPPDGGGTERNMNKYGIQMYSLRDITGTDLDGALAKAAAMGYKTIEFAGFFGHTAEEVRAMLDRYGLEVIGTHSSYNDLLEDFEGTVRFHKTLGNTNFVIPGWDFSTRTKLNDFLESSKTMIPRLRREGIELHYHNHHWEYMTTPEGYIAHKELEKNSDILFELDTYWTFYAGLDPLAELDRLGDRVKLIHIKDGKPSANEGCSLGQGDAPVKAIWQKCCETDRSMIVESEGLNPTGEEEVRRCIDYLFSLG